MKKFFNVVLILSLVGCANNNVWVKDGAGTNEFNSDKYTCMQQSQQQQGVAVVNAYGGAATNGQVTNWNLFNNCMQARGWHTENKDAYQENAQQKQVEFNQKRTEIQSAVKVIDEKLKALCEKSEYKPYFLKTSCSAKDINFEQLADSTKIISEQSTPLIKYRSEVDSLTKEKNDYLRQNGTDGDRRWISYLDSIQPDIEKYNLDLYKGIITWGEYNQRRKELTTKLMDEYRKMFPTAH